MPAPIGGSGAREPPVRIRSKTASQSGGSDPPTTQSGEHRVAVGEHRQLIAATAAEGAGSG
jgi:hypothetical protein